MIEDPRDPRLKTPQACETMRDVRYEVDRIDRLLVTILAERQALMDAAARIKPTRDVVRDPVRIEDVVAKVLKSARRAGLDPLIAETVWRTLIEQCIQYEFRAWDEQRAVATTNKDEKHPG